MSLKIKSVLPATSHTWGARRAWAFRLCSRSAAVILSYTPYTLHPQL